MSEEQRQDDRERELRDEYMRLWRERDGSEGHRVLLRNLSLGTALDMFRGNHAELKGFLHHVAAPSVLVHMWNQEHRYRLEYAQREVVRLLHNYVAAAFSLDNSTRRFVREHYSGTQLFKEYESRVERDFEQAPLHNFLQGLCDHTMRRRLPPVKARTEFKTCDDGRQDFEGGFWLNVEKMRGWNDWTDGAREYMESLGDEAKLDDIVDVYEPVVVGFNQWLSERIQEEHAEAIEATLELERRMTMAEDELRRYEAGRGRESDRGSYEGPDRGQPETLEDPERELILNSLTDPDDGSNRDAIATPEDVVSFVYESLTFPYGGVPNLDRFGSLFLPDAQIVRVEEDGTYLTDIDGLIQDYHLSLNEGSVTAVHEHETARRSFPLGDVAHILSFHETRYIENGEEKRSQGMYDLHMVRAGERWAITGMHICAGYGVRQEPTTQERSTPQQEGNRAATKQGDQPTKEHMKPELHPEAAKNFEEKARDLLEAVEPETGPEPAEAPTDMFRPGGHVVATFDADELPNFSITGQSDRLGRTTARYFEHEGRRYGLEGEQYEVLARLSEAVQRTKAFRELVSTKWVEDTILDWMKVGFDGGTAPALGDYLTERCEEDVQEHELWFPVSHFSVESDLPFGHIVFRTITEGLMDKMVENTQGAKEGRDATYAAQLDMRMTRERAELQGLAAATVKVRAESSRAYEVALRESERAVAAIRMYQVAATTTPEVTSYCALLGRENVEGIKHLEMENNRIRTTSDQAVGKPVLHWHLSDHDVRNHTRSLGFREVSELLVLGRRTRFQETLLDALLLYSRSTREKDISGKLVYTFAAMESVLLRNETEPIQQNVGERIAFINQSTAEKRREVIRNYKTVYGLRSKFVHHGHTIEERDTVWRFMIEAWALFTSLAKASSRFETKEALIDHLEGMKLS